MKVQDALFKSPESDKFSLAGSSPVYYVEFHADGYVTSGAGEMVFCSVVGDAPAAQ